MVIEGLGAVLPFFKNMFTELLDFFDGVAQNKEAIKASAL
jgi:hypothetical protein